MAQNQNTTIAYKAIAWFTSNAEITLQAGIHVYYGQTGLYKIGDGVTKLADLLWLGGTSPSPSPLPSSWENISGAGTTQGTANISTAKKVFITGGVAGSGIQCADAILGFEQLIVNQTAVSQWIYPMSGNRFLNRITLLAINAPIPIASRASIGLFCNVIGQMSTT